MKKRLLPALCLLFFSSRLLAQSAFLPLSREVEQPLQKTLNKPGNGVHTSFHPFMTKDVYRAVQFQEGKTLDTEPDLNKYGRFCDSLSLINFLSDARFATTRVGRKLYSEHLLQVEDGDVHLYADPLLEFSGGSDMENKRTLSNNTRGVRINGSVGKRFGFNASFYENQGKFAAYLDSSIRKTRIVPGQGRVKSTGDGSYDYAFATGTIHYSLNKHFTFEFGQDRHFIGDGYRSLLLSDNAFHYPFFKITTDIWKIRYVNLFMELRDISREADDNSPFLKKYASMHYLDINIGKRMSLGLFEGVLWHADSLDGARGFDLGYMNPFIFFRPVEFSIGSPDNVLMGLNLKYLLNNHNTLYAQVMLDEFLLKNVRAGNGWWANKQGIQAGFKSYDLFGIKSLYLQGEINYVRPYTYQHIERLGTYTHYRSPLAHPLGANFTEGIAIVRYQHQRWQLDTRFSYAKTGIDTGGLNYGQNVFLTYDTHVSEFGNKTGQGLKTEILWAEGTLSYVLNPLYRLSVFATAGYRSYKQEGADLNTVLLQAGIRTGMFNRYYDF